MSSSGISRAIWNSAPRSRQITMPAPHHSVFTGRMPFLPPNQQRQSAEGVRYCSVLHNNKSNPTYSHIRHHHHTFPSSYAADATLSKQDVPSFRAMSAQRRFKLCSLSSRSLVESRREISSPTAAVICWTRHSYDVNPFSRVCNVAAKKHSK